MYSIAPLRLRLTFFYFIYLLNFFYKKSIHYTAQTTGQMLSLMGPHGPYPSTFKLEINLYYVEIPAGL